VQATGAATRRRTKRQFMAAIDRTAGAQHGLVTHAQLTALGASKAKLRTMVEKGQVLRLTRGVYRLPGAPRTWHQAARAATLAGSGAVLSHRAAAHLLLGDTRHTRIEVCVQRGRRRARRDGLTAHATRRLDNADVAVRSGIPCTSPLRTLSDLGGTLQQAELEDTVCNFVNQRLISARSLCDYLLGGGRGAHRPGARALRRCIDAVLGAKTESVAEQRLLRLWRESGLPSPEAQVEVHDEQGRFVARVDFALTRERIAVEMDSWRYHGDPASFQRDRLRTMRLSMLGWRVIHVTPAALREQPEVVLAAIRNALHEADRRIERAAPRRPPPKRPTSPASPAWRWRHPRRRPRPEPVKGYTSGV